MKIRASLLSTIVAALSAGALLSCLGSYDPFADRANAGARLSYQSVHGGDTVSIYRTETLQVVVAVKELTSRFSLSARANRLWRSDTVVDRSSFEREPFTFTVSLRDTGWQTVALTSYLTDGSVSRETLSLYVVSPLRQAPLSGFYAQPLALSTPPVGDPGIVYHWLFGAGTEVVSFEPTVWATITVSGAAGIGRLWVSEPDGKHATPSAPFTFALDDDTPPEILCVNPGYSGGDTVRTGDSVFTFRVKITDRGDGVADSASVNAEPFDRMVNNVYSKRLARTGPAPQVTAVDVYAVDHFSFGNDTTRRFWVLFSDSGPVSPGVILTVTTPSGYRDSTSSAGYMLAGTLEASAADTLTLDLRTVANGEADSGMVVVSSGQVLWTRQARLLEGENAVRILVTASSGRDTLSTASRLITYRPDVPDTTGPAILEILADNHPADRYFSTKSTVVVAVRATDAGSGVDSLWVNESVAVLQAGWYYDTVALAHLPAGNEVAVRAVDRRGNAARKTVVVFVNKIGMIARTPASRTVWVDSLYRDTARSVDADGDALVFSKQSGPSLLVVEPAGAVYWTPTPADTGRHSVTLRLWDGYQPAYATYALYVATWGSKPGPLAFHTTAEDFPRFLEAGADSLRITLVVEPNTGVAPFTYAARIVGVNTPLLSSGQGNVLRWKPAAADAGYRQLIVSVKDEFGGADTLYPRINVVPPNQPCVVTVSYATPARADGVLNFNARRLPDTLGYRIFDPDDPLTEKHRITITQARTRTTSVIDSAAADSFRVVVDPTALDGYDTITVVVSDRGEAADSLRVRCYYGVRPDQPRLLSPALEAAAIDTAVVLRWHGSDPDGDILYYEVFMGTNEPALRGTVADTALAVSGLLRATTYFWSVRARDWKGMNESATFSFTTRN